MKVEVFTAGCPLCNPVVDLVRSTACDNCEVIVFDLVKQCDSMECMEKVTAYGIIKVPAVAVNGVLLDCCKGTTITRKDLVAAGIGSNN